MIKVRSKDDNGNKKCCSGIVTLCFAPIAGCLASLCCCICCPLNCCKVLWDAFVHGPKRNRRSDSKANDQLDYQIGDMPGDSEKQIIILQKQIEKVGIKTFFIKFSSALFLSIKIVLLRNTCTIII